MQKLTLIILFLALYNLVTSIHSPTLANQIDPFPTSWEYQKIFAPTDIPLPTSAQNLNAQVKAVYSPSVIYFNNEYIMFFGVSISCQNGTVARDSIASAKSQDGMTWHFYKYIVEPSTITCSTPINQWPNNTTFQVNDPKAHPVGAQIFIFYTTVTWPDDNYGNIGIVHLNQSLDITHRNDKYLVGSNILGGAGFSRPDIRYQTNPPELWVDSGGSGGIAKIGSIPITSYYNLDNSKVRREHEDLGGLDINLPKLSNTHDLILFNGSTINVRQKSINSSTWGELYPLIQKTNQGWDSWFQGSPDLFLDPTNCHLRLYFAGGVDSGHGWYESISIGIATPIQDIAYHYDACPLSPPTSPSPSPSPSLKPGDLTGDGKVDIFDYQKLLSDFGNPYTIFDYQKILANFGK